VRIRELGNKHAKKRLVTRGHGLQLNLTGTFGDEHVQDVGIEEVSQRARTRCTKIHPKINDVEMDVGHADTQHKLSHCFMFP